MLATGDAASGFIDPSLRQLLSIGAVASLTVGATLNVLVFPQLNRVSMFHISFDAIHASGLCMFGVVLLLNFFCSNIFQFYSFLDINNSCFN